SQRATYDGRGTMRIANQPDIPVPRTDADLQNIEFKLHLRDLVADFEEEVKVAREISLVVVWDGDLPSKVVDYQVVDIEHTKDADRAMGGVTKCILCKREARYIQLLVLSEVLAEAASPSAIVEAD
ncbi:hypothetical protein LCGC14_2809380, partial [marine sediment metagenome]